jgi:hypothetical protein
MSSIRGSEAFDWRPKEGGLAWRMVQELPRRRSPARAGFALGVLVTLAIVVGGLVLMVRL